MATTKENSSVSLAKTSSSTERRSLLFNKSEYPGFHQAFYGHEEDDMDGEQQEQRINLAHTLPRRSRKKDKHGEEVERSRRRKSRIKLLLLHRKGKKEDELGESGMGSKEDDEESSGQMFRPGAERGIKGSDLEQDPSSLYSNEDDDYEDSDSDSAFPLEYSDYYRETNDDITNPRPVETGFEGTRTDRLQDNLDKQDELNRKLYESRMRGSKKSRKARSKEARKEKRDRKKLEKKDRARGKKASKKLAKKKIAVEKLENLRKNFKPSLNLLHHKSDDETEQGHELVL